MADLKAKVNRGDEARALQKQLDPYLDDMRQEVYKNIRKSNFFQKAERENCYKMLRAIDLFEGRLKKRINDGKMAKHKLKTKE